MPRPSTEPRHVVLLGEMGAGKTTVGRILAERLGRPFLDGDVVLEATRGMTAAEIASTGGIEALHADEAATLGYLLGQTHPSVIAPAASVVEDPAALVALEDPALLIVWLTARPEILAARAQAGVHRPWLGVALFEHLRDTSPKRGPSFAKLADLVIDVDAVAPEEAAEVVARAVRDWRPATKTAPARPD